MDLYNLFKKEKDYLPKKGMGQNYEYAVLVE